MMPFINTRGDCSMKLKGAVWKFPAKEFLNRKSCLMNVAYPTRYRSQNNKLVVAGTDDLKGKMMSISCPFSANNY